MTVTNNAPTLCPGGLTNIIVNSVTTNAVIELIGLSVSPNAGGVTGSTSVGSQWGFGFGPLPATIADNLVNTTNLIQTVTYTFRVSASGFVSSSTQTAVVSVNPAPVMTIDNQSPSPFLSGQMTDIRIATPTQNGQVRLLSVTKDAGISGNSLAGVIFTNGAIVQDVLTNSLNIAQNITYQFEVIANGCVNPTTIDVTITVNPVPQMTVDNQDPVLCPGEPTSIDISSVTANAVIELTNVTLSQVGSITGFTPAGTTWNTFPELIADPLVNTTDQIQTITYQFEVSASGFTSSAIQTAVVTVNPQPVMTATNNNPIINSGTATNILINIPTQNGQVALIGVIKPASITGNTSVGVSYSDGNAINDILSSTSDVPETIKYIFEPSANGCVNTAERDTSEIIVTPLPIISVDNNNPDICSDELTDIILNSPTFGAEIELIGVNITPTAGGVTGFIPVGTQMTALPFTINDQLQNSTSLTQRIEYIFQVSTGGFVNPTTTSVFVNVKPLPTISALASEICSNNITDISIGNPNNVSFTIFNWETFNTGVVTGESNGTGNKITQQLFNSTSNLDSVIYRIYATAQSCQGDSIDVVQYVYPRNIVNAGTDIVVCQGTPVIQIGDASFGGGTTTLSWTIVNGGGSLSNETTITPVYSPNPTDEVGTVSLQLAGIGAAVCPVVSDIVNIAINTRPVVDAGTDLVICEGDNALLSGATIGGSASSVTWVDATGLGTFSPNANTLNAIFIPNPSQVGTSVKLYITTNNPTGPCEEARDSLLVTINQAPVVNAGANKVICEGDVVVMSDATFGGSTSSVTWSGGSGVWDNVNLLNATYTPAASETGTTITLTITSNVPSGPCGAVSDQVQVTIQKAPEVFAGADKVVCEGGTILIGDATSGGSTTSVTWSGGSGIFSPNNTTLNTTYIPTSAEIGTTFTLTITTNAIGPCVAVSDQVDITINQVPIVNAGTDKLICEGDAIAMSDATIGGSTSTVTWSGGLGTWDNVNLLSATYSPAVSEIGTTVILTITSNDPDGAGPCSFVTDQMSLTINKAPEVDAGEDRVICETSTVNLNGSISGSATSATWSTAGDGTFSFIGDLNARYTPGTNDKANGGVLLTLTTNDPSGPCIAVSDDVFVQIDETPIVDAGVYAPICIGDTIFLSGSIGGSATSATWTGGIGTFLNPNQLSTAYIPEQVERGSDVIFTLTTNDPAGVCFAASSQTEVTIYRLSPTGFSGLKATYQVDDASSALNGVPPGGLYTGAGILGNSFIPSFADTGTHVIRYTFTDENGCTNFEDQTTVVFPLPEAEIGDPGPYCLGVDPIANPLPRTAKPGFTDSWSGNNVFSQAGQYYFNNSVAGVGLHEVTYTLVDVLTGAEINEPRFIQVNDVPVIQFTTGSNCVADTIQFIDQSFLPSGSVFNDNITAWKWEIGINKDFESVEQNPRIKFENSRPDNYVVRLEATTKFSCVGSGSLEIPIGAIPAPVFSRSNLTLGEQSEFRDITLIPTTDTSFPSGYVDPTTGIDYIWWDFEEAQQEGPYSTLGTAYHQFSQGNREYQVTMTIETNLGCINSVTNSISILESISAYPYTEDFENFNPDAARGNNSSWHLKQPNGAIITGTGKAWVTSNAENRHNDNEHSYVPLPAFDLRSLTRPMFSIDIWSNSESTRDGAVLQYSFDGGEWFTVVDPNNQNLTNYPIGQIGLEWYNEKGLVSRPGDLVFDNQVGTNEGSFGWTGIYSNWRTARFPLDEIRNELIQTNQASVRFRVVFSSDQQNPEGTTYDGFAFDNLWVGDRTHNVLIEHFDNLSRGNQINNMNTIADRFWLDMIPLQYHTKYPSEDEIYRNNKFPVETRGSIYDINQSPRAFMDGIKEYDFSGSLIEDYQIINRSLIDPLFDIDLDIVPTGNVNDIDISVTVTANDTLNEEVTVYVIPIETSIRNLETMPTLDIDSLNNIAKDMLPSGGRLIDISWQSGTSNTFEVNWDLNKLNKENEIYDNTKLGVIVFIQNAVNQGSREIYQVVYSKLPVLENTIITGLEDELNARRIQDADIYPNPAQNYFNISLSNELSKDMDWTIIDQRGVELLRGEFAAGEDLYEVDTRKLPNGLHMMIVSGDNDHKVIRKVIISR